MTLYEKFWDYKVRERRHTIAAQNLTRPKNRARRVKHARLAAQYAAKANWMLELMEERAYSR